MKKMFQYILFFMMISCLWASETNTNISSDGIAEIYINGQTFENEKVIYDIKDKAKITYPVVNRRLRSTTMRVRWVKNDAYKVKIRVYDYKTHKNYYTSSTTGTDTYINDLPSHGGRMVLILYSYDKNNTSIGYDRRFVYAVKSFKKAEILSPIPNEELTSTSMTVRWQKNDATKVYLYVYDYGSKSVRYQGYITGSTTSKTITGLSYTGKKIHVYLSSYEGKKKKGYAQVYVTAMKTKPCITRVELIDKIKKDDDVTEVNTSCITDMSYLFAWNRSFNQDIGNWDVSNVTNMNSMFYRAKSFNQSLNKWNVSKVKDMGFMFYWTNHFNQPLDKWDVGNVTSMEFMFTYAFKFNQDINNWNVSKVKNMRYMFYWAYAFNQSLNKWNVGNVTTMSYMFYKARKFNQNISRWNVSKVTDHKNFETKSALKDSHNPFKTVVSFNVMSHQHLLGSYDTSGDAKDVILSADGTKAYVADGTKGLKIIDISNPLRPTQLGSYDTSGDAEGVTLSSDGTKAYVADWHKGLKIIDISNPATPILLGSYHDNGHTSAITLSVDGTKAYMSNNVQGLTIIDISDPTTPTRLGYYDTDGSIFDVALSSNGKRVYVADGHGGLKIIDVSNPATPIQIGAIDTNSWANAVTLSSDEKTVYVSTGSRGLQIIDVSNAATPTVIGTLNTDGHAADVTLSSDGTKAYVADYNKGLKIINISNPATPTMLSSYDMGGHANAVTLSSDGTRAYVANGSGGVKIISIVTSTHNYAKNFKNGAIELKIDSSNEATFTLEVTADRDDIVSIEAFDNELSYDEYHDKTISIPIEAITDRTGKTIITLILSNGIKTYTRKVYFNVSP